MVSRAVASSSSSSRTTTAMLPGHSLAANSTRRMWCSTARRIDLEGARVDGEQVLAADLIEQPCDGQLVRHVVASIAPKQPLHVHYRHDLQQPYVGARCFRRALTDDPTVDLEGQPILYSTDMRQGGQRASLVERIAAEETAIRLIFMRGLLSAERSRSGPWAGPSRLRSAGKRRPEDELDLGHEATRQDEELVLLAHQVERTQERSGQNTRGTAGEVVGQRVREDPLLGPLSCVVEHLGQRVEAVHALLHLDELVDRGGVPAIGNLIGHHQLLEVLQEGGQGCAMQRQRLVQRRLAESSEGGGGCWSWRCQRLDAGIVRDVRGLRRELGTVQGACSRVFLSNGFRGMKDSISNQVDAWLRCRWRLGQGGAERARMGLEIID